MKNTELQELREKDVAELQGMVAALRRELLDDRIKTVTAGEAPGMRKRQMRRQVARLLTIISEKQGADAA